MSAHKVIPPATANNMPAAAPPELVTTSIARPNGKYRVNTTTASSTVNTARRAASDSKPPTPVQCGPGGSAAAFLGIRSRCDWFACSGAQEECGDDLAAQPQSCDDQQRAPEAIDFNRRPLPGRRRHGFQLHPQAERRHHHVADQHQAGRLNRGHRAGHRQPAPGDRIGQVDPLAQLRHAFPHGRHHITCSRLIGAETQSKKRLPDDEKTLHQVVDRQPGREPQGQINRDRDSDQPGARERGTEALCERVHDAQWGRLVCLHLLHFTTDRRFPETRQALSADQIGSLVLARRCAAGLKGTPQKCRSVTLRQAQGAWFTDSFALYPCLNRQLTPSTAWGRIAPGYHRTPTAMCPYR